MGPKVKKESTSLLLRKKVEKNVASRNENSTNEVDQKPDDFDESKEEIFTTGKAKLTDRKSKELMKGMAAIFKEEGMEKLVYDLKKRKAGGEKPKLSDSSDEDREEE